MFIHVVGAVELVAECRVGIAAKEKLRNVIEWVQKTGYTALHNVEANDCQVLFPQYFILYCQVSSNSSTGYLRNLKITLDAFSL